MAKTRKVSAASVKSYDEACAEHVREATALLKGVRPGLSAEDAEFVAESTAKLEKFRLDAYFSAHQVARLRSLQK